MLKFFILFFLLISCASKEKSSLVNERNEVVEHFLKLFPKQGQIVQLIEYERESDFRKVQVVFRKKKKLRAVVLSDFGVEVLSVEVSEKRVDLISSLPGIKVNFFDQVMRDMLMAYASREQLVLIPFMARMKIVETSKERSIFSSEGKEFFSVRYINRKRWHGDVKIMNKAQSYNLTISTISYEK